MFRWQKETQADYVDPTPPLNETDPPPFVPPMSPSKVIIPGRWQEGDAAWTPNFNVKTSVGFTPSEHPDRPTLLSELAAERAKEEDVKTEDAASRKEGRRKNELDHTQIITDPFIAYGLSQAKWIRGLTLTDQLVSVIKQQQSGMSSAEARKYIIQAEAGEIDQHGGMDDTQSSEEEDEDNSEMEKSVSTRSKASSKRKKKGLKIGGLGMGILSGKGESEVKKRERRFKEELARRNDGIQRFSYDSISAFTAEEQIPGGNFQKALADVEAKQAALASITIASADGDENADDYQSIDPKSITIASDNLGMDPPDNESLGLQSAGTLRLINIDPEIKSPTDDFLAAVRSIGTGSETAGDTPVMVMDENLISNKSHDNVASKNTHKSSDNMGCVKKSELETETNLVQGISIPSGEIVDPNRSDNNDNGHLQRIDASFLEDPTSHPIISQHSPAVLENTMNRDNGDNIIQDSENDQQRRQREERDINLQVLHRPSITSYAMSDELDEEDQEDGFEGDDVFIKPVTRQSIKINSPVKTVVNDPKGEISNKYLSQGSDSKDSLNVKGSKITRGRLDSKGNDADSLNLSVSKQSQGESIVSQLEVSRIYMCASLSKYSYYIIILMLTVLFFNSHLLNRLLFFISSHLTNC